MAIGKFLIESRFIENSWKYRYYKVWWSLRRLKIRLFGYVISTISHLKGYK
jgi:hypothetical protein